MIIIKLNIKENKWKILIIVTIILLILLGIRFYIDNNVYEITNLIIEDDEIPKAFENTTILHITDLHNKSYGKNNIKLIKDIKNINPDYIFMTGDMVSSRDVDFTPFYELIEEIGNKYPTFYVLGNHELDLPNSLLEDIYSTLKEYNIKILDNEMVEINKKGDKINIYGMWYNSKFYMKEKFLLSDMNKLLNESREGYNLLLTHNPDDFEVYSNWGADLTFAGHIHGGMIRIPFIGGLISPKRTLFPKYDAGLYEFNNNQMILSRGMSAGQTGFRLFNQPELVVVTLKTK